MDDSLLSQGLAQEEQPIAENINEIAAVEEGQLPASPENDLPAYAKERLGRQQKKYDRQIRSLNQQLAALQGQLQAQPAPSPYGGMNGDMQSQQEPANNIQAYINQAVQGVFQKQEEMRRHAEQMQQAEYVQGQYNAFKNHLEDVGNNYDDFEDVVMSPGAPFTDSIRDLALGLPFEGKGSAAEVLYKLGKNKEELSRIAKLHPIDQMREMNKLSRALELASLGGGNAGNNNAGASRAMNQLKSNPAYLSSGDVNESTSIAELKKRARAGWK